MFGSLNAHRGLVYVTAGNLVGAMITGGFWLLLATIQSPEEYGNTNYGIAISSLASSIVLVGLNTVSTKYLAKGSARIHIEANQVIFICSAIAAAIVGILYNWISGLFVIGMAYWMMSLYEALGKKLYKQYALINIGSRFLQFVLSLVLFFTLGLEGVVIGFTISFFLFSYRYFGTIRRFNFRQFSEVKGLVKFASHSYSLNMSNAFFMYFDKLIIVPFFGAAVLGLYQIGFQFLMFLGMIPISFYQYLLPEQSSGSAKTKVHIYGFLVAVILAVLLFALSPWILENIFPNFSDSTDVVRIMSTGIVPMMLSGTLNSKFVASNHTKNVVVGSVIYLTVQVSLMFTLVQTLGSVGVAIATVCALISQASFLVVSSRLMPKTLLAS